VNSRHGLKQNLENVEHLEHNPLFKPWKKGMRRVALVYPNRYVGGISNIGLQYIYAKINSMDGFVCERFYLDVFDGLRSVETGTPLKDFDIALFSLQYEEDYFNAVRILQKSGFSGFRVAGGPCVTENPKPLLDYFDVFVVGEVENSDILEKILGGETEGEGICTGEEGLKTKVRRLKPEKLEEHILTQIVGEGAYGRCVLLEIGRGCGRGCTFCIVRQIYSPLRWRDPELILSVAEANKGAVNKAAIIAPSPSDHPKFKEIVWQLAEMGYMVSPSSVRADRLTPELMELLAEAGLKSLTIAPEAGSERMRETLRKGIGEEDVISAAEMAKEKGISSIKMYFMIGLPGETEEDVRAIVELTSRVKRIMGSVSVSVNPLVPKPHTPLQWMPYGGDFSASPPDNLKKLEQKAKFLKKEFARMGVKAEVESVEKFAVQTVLSRGGRDAASLLTKKPKLSAIRKLGLEKYLGEIDVNQELPWDFIDAGYRKSRILREYEMILALIG
jgi:radical SAM superfamily enzyme YgiQ (UPF0313 family)